MERGGLSSSLGGLGWDTGAGPDLGRGTLRRPAQHYLARRHARFGAGISRAVRPAPPGGTGLHGHHCGFIIGAVRCVCDARLIPARR